MPVAVRGGQVVSPNAHYCPEHCISLAHKLFAAVAALALYLSTLERGLGHGISRLCYGFRERAGPRPLAPPGEDAIGQHEPNFRRLLGDSW